MSVGTWENESGQRPTDSVTVRTLSMRDLDAVVAIDAANEGRTRSKFLEQRLTRALQDSGIRLALGAEVDGRLVGFLLGAIQYGEFGVMEPTATIDVVDVRPDARGMHVGAAMLEQAEMQLRALGIERIRTQVDWGRFALLGFFEHAGFAPAPVLCLEKKLG